MPGIKGGWLGAVLHVYPSEMAQNFWTAICGVDRLLRRTIVDLAGDDAATRRTTSSAGWSTR